MQRIAATLGVLIAITAAAKADIVMPTSYDTPNGYTGAYTYWDESYSGAGDTTVDGASLTGGLGDLTDGVVASDNWFFLESPPGPGPYVGWNIDPTITFHFASAVDFETVRIYFDDSDGAGGVSAPSSVAINGTSFSVADPAGFAPFFVDFALSGVPTDQLSIQLMRSNVWVFASEFTFTARAVPEPASIVMLGTGAVGLLGYARRRKVSNRAA